MATEIGAVLGNGDGQSIFKESLDEAAGLAMFYLAKLDQGPVGATADAALLRTRIAKALSRCGLPAKQVVRWLISPAWQRRGTRCWQSVRGMSKRKDCPVRQPSGWCRATKHTGQSAGKARDASERLQLANHERRRHAYGAQRGEAAALAALSGRPRIDRAAL